MVLTGTHRLRDLGITSPFDLPEDPYNLLKLIAIVFEQENTFSFGQLRFIFKYFSEPLSQTLRATRTTG